jgi:hypothetical protein
MGSGYKFGPYDPAAISYSANVHVRTKARAAATTMIVERMSIFVAKPGRRLCATTNGLATGRRLFPSTRGCRPTRQ